MQVVKLVDAGGYTRRGVYGETLWLPVSGQTVVPVGEGSKPCGPGVFHAYLSELEAALYDPIHGNYGLDAMVIDLDIQEISGDDGLSIWTTLPVRVVGGPRPLTQISPLVRAAWAICLIPRKITRDWAINWLSGSDRSTTSAICAGACLQTADVWTWETWAAEAAMIGVREPAKASVWAKAAAWAAALVASCAAAWIVDETRADFRARSLAALERGQLILAGQMPAEKYDEF